MIIFHLRLNILLSYYIFLNLALDKILLLFGVKNLALELIVIGYNNY